VISDRAPQRDSGGRPLCPGSSPVPRRTGRRGARAERGSGPSSGRPPRPDPAGVRALAP